MNTTAVGRPFKAIKLSTVQNLAIWIFALVQTFLLLPTIIKKKVYIYHSCTNSSFLGIEKFCVPAQVVETYFKIQKDMVFEYVMYISRKDVLARRCILAQFLL